MNSQYRSADSAASELAANLRLCRTKAVATGYHYQLNVTGLSTYAVNRMLPPTGGSDWTVDTDTPTLTMALPPNVRFTNAIGRYEFDTRGNVVLRSGETLESLKTLNDSVAHHSAFVQVWASGQVL